jgi:CheY-like chemotaxis protein
MDSRPLVMVVDDDDDVRESVSLLLSDEGYDVVTAPNGAVALNELQEGVHPSLIVLDLMMPVMSGWEFRDRQLHDADLAPIPVIVLTAAGEPLGNLGGARVLSKAAGARVLLAAVERAVAPMAH